MLCGEQAGGMVGKVIRRPLHSSYGDGDGVENADGQDGQKNGM